MSELRNLYNSMLSEAETMQAFLEERPEDDVCVLAEKLADATIYIARSGKLLAEAKRIQDECIRAAYEKFGDDVEKLGAKMAKQVLMSYCKDSSYLVNWMDRINRGLVHQSENYRTLISLGKENMRLTRYADQPR